MAKKPGTNPKNEFVFFDVIYEDLCTNYVERMREVQEFLGVQYESVVAGTYKQSKQPLAQAISNYQELRNCFRGSVWEDFFEE